MTIQIELDPATEARLVAEAESRGLPVEEYATSLLRQSVPHDPRGTGRLTPEGFARMSEQMTKWSHKIPVLPPEATERESCYEDRW